jgi:hypothetical protein
MGSIALPAQGVPYIDTNGFIYAIELVAPYQALLEPLWQDLRTRALRAHQRVDADGDAGKTAASPGCGVGDPVPQHPGLVARGSAASHLTRCPGASGAAARYGATQDA